MKKLMFAAATAALVGGAFAACEPEEIEVARVYQVQMDVCTTKGVAVGGLQTGSVCDPETSCVVMRGKDMTVLRGYLYICDSVCELSDYSTMMADARRKALFEDAAFEWDFLNIIGANGTDAECAWTFRGTVVYNEEQAGEYELRGAGYGVFNKDDLCYDDLSGNFAGIATAPFDLTADVFMTECGCQPSQVLKCDCYIDFEFMDENTVAFGTWKMKYNPEITKAYMASGEYALLESLVAPMK